MNAQRQLGGDSRQSLAWFICFEAAGLGVGGGPGRVMRGVLRGVTAAVGQGRQAVCLGCAVTIAAH